MPPAVVVRFYRGRGLYAWAIRLWTRSPYTHCNVVVPDEPRPTLCDAHADTGVRVCWACPTLPLFAAEIQVPVESVQAVVDAAVPEIGCAYDWRGIFLAQVLGLHREDPHRWFCSELCAHLLRAGGYALPKRNCDYSPGKLFRALSRKP